jgi:uncharacterized protein YbjT (DUF2867 family)
MESKLYTVIGGSGFVGRYVVQELAARGHRVRVAVRNPNLALFLKPLGAVGQIQLVQANVRNAPSVARACADADGVVNLVGILSESGYQSFQEVQAEGAKTIAEAARATGVQALVHVSAIGADAASDSNYARTKAEAEQAVLSAMPSAMILRPSLIFGAEDGFFNRFAGLAKIAPIMPVICGDTKFQPVYVADVAQAIVAALEAPHQFGGQTFELGGPKAYRFRDLLRYVLDETLYNRPLVDVPLPIAKLQAALTGWLPKAPLTSDQLILLQTDNVPVADKPGLPTFGITPTPVEAIVPSYLKRYRPKGQFSEKAA